LFDTSSDKEFDISDFEDRIGTVVMGHTTYRETQRLSEQERIFLIRKDCFSRSEKGNIIEGNYVSGDPVAVINRLKAEAGQAIWVVGGGEIVTTL
jgi:dihydrofolate reductase